MRDMAAAEQQPSVALYRAGPVAPLRRRHISQPLRVYAHLLPLAR
jgi:hypothetical protein